MDLKRVHFCILRQKKAIGDIELEIWKDKNIYWQQKRGVKSMYILLSGMGSTGDSLFDWLRRLLGW